MRPLRIGARALACAPVLALAACATAAPPRPDAFIPRQAHIVALRDKAHVATKNRRQAWALTRPLTYRTLAGDTITVPAGMVTDLASIPAFVSPILPPDGPWSQAAMVHDFLYLTHGTCVWKRHPSSCSRAAPYSRAEADRILFDAMGDLGVTGWRPQLIYDGVRLGGSVGWGD